MSAVIHRPGRPGMSRRRFLRDLGVSVGATSLVVGLDSLFAKAQVASLPKKRFVFMSSPNGMLYSAWRFPQPGTNIDLTTTNAQAMLHDPARTLQPLAPNANKLLVLDRLSFIGARPVYQDLASLLPGTLTVDGIDHPGGAEKGMGNLLTGQVLIGGAQNFGSPGLANGPSIDQVIASQLFKGNVVPSLQIAVMGTNDLYAYNDTEVDKVLSYTGPSAPLVPVSDPFVLFRTLFGPGTPMYGSPSGPTLRQIMDKSVLDGVQADFTRLQPRVSMADWQLLQQHQTNVRDIETQLTKLPPTGNCSTPIAPATPAGVDITDPQATLAWTEVPSSYPISGAMLMQIMVQALACGLTNVVTFQWAHAEDNLSYNFLNLGPNAGLPASQCGLTGVGHKNMAHERDPNLIFLDQFYASQFNNMITMMNAIPDSGVSGSLLDNSLLMHTSELSDGSSHISDNMAITLAGSNGGYFKQGQLLRFNSVFNPLPIPANADPNSYFLTDEWYTTAIQQIAAMDQATVGTPDLSNNDLMASILDSFGLDITKVAPSMTDSRFFHGLLPGVKAGT